MSLSADTLDTMGELPYISRPAPFSGPLGMVLIALLSSAIHVVSEAARKDRALQ